MWILFRLGLAVVALAARWFGRFRRRKGVPAGVGDQTVFLAQSDNLRGGKDHFVGVELDAPIWFRLHRETGYDRWFKRVGLATEIETDDREFDKFVYIACDHPMFEALLKRSAEARQLISELLWAGVTRIDYRGDLVWCSLKRKPSAHEQSLVARLGKALAPLREDGSSRLSDPFLGKALLVEGIVWSIAAFAASALIVTLSLPEIYLTDASYLRPGLGLAAGLLALLIALAWFFLRGSSRGHRLIIESAVVLTFGLPIAGIQVFDDLNRGLDKSVMEIRTKGSECQRRVATSPGLRPRTTITHWLHVSGSAEGITLPSPVRFPGVCEGAPRGTPATFTLGRGALGAPWYRRISVGDYSWTP